MTEPENPLADMKPQSIPLVGVEEVDDADQTVKGRLAETGQQEGHWTAPPILGTPAANVDYGNRVWKENDYTRETWTPPEVYPPIMRATRCRIDVSRTKTGNIKGVVVSMPRITPEPTIPTSMLTLVKRLAAYGDSHEPEGFEIVATYARGYDVDAKGEMKRDAIWVENTPNEDDDRKRIRVGFKDPEPVDSWLVRAAWREIMDAETTRLTRIIGGWWTNGKPDFFQIWEHDRPFRHFATITPFNEAVQEILNAPR